MLADLADLFRYVLDRAAADAVPLKDELEFAKSYLDLEAHRFHDRLDVRYDIDAPEDALDVRVPPIILQPLVENAIKHGISPSEDGGTISVSVTRESAARLASLPATQADGRPDDEPSANGGGQPEGPPNGPVDGDLLRVEVLDTGIGPDDSFEPGPVGSSNHAGRVLPSGNGAASSDGVGLTNTNRRLLHHFGSLARLYAEPVSPNGFRVWFHLPHI
jgi:LytS/YehU family sensor histidine kinase